MKREDDRASWLRGDGMIVVMRGGMEAGFKHTERMTGDGGGGGLT